MAEEERRGVVEAADRLRQAGIPCPVVSAGSTPTATHATDLSGVTEMRPGAYVFFDLEQCALGSCRREELALSVLASVIGYNRRADHLLVDAGALALSKDAGDAAPGSTANYGELCDPRTLEPLPGLQVRQVNQEHGIVPLAGPSPPIDARVRILPNHACLTAAGHDRYHVVEGARVVDEWERVNYW